MQILQSLRNKTLVINLKNNTKMKNILKYVIALSIILTAFSCEDELIVYDVDNGQTALSFSRASSTVGICNPNVDVIVQSTTRSSVARTYSIAVNSESTALASEYNVGTSVVIPAGEFVGSTAVTVDFTQISAGTSRSLILDLIASGGAVLHSQKSISVNYASACVLNEVVVDLKFDQYPEEAAYFIRNSSGAIVDGSFNASGSLAFGVHAGLTAFTKTLCLPSGAYTITFLDQYQDGNDGNANGSYGLNGVTCAGTVALIARVRGSNFGSGANARTVSFTLGS
jgi:hypothetical protein